MNEEELELLKAIAALLEAINADNGPGGGLLSRATIRRADELRIEVAKRMGQVRS